ncbi:MAG: glycosyltransferase, partial [Alphaproteobacteria bacterium]|nr:glycosyltransferase [Alphaproteobacteria bacterium]
MPNLLHQPRPAAHAARAAETPLSVGVLVDLERGVMAGGHVKCWERLAEAAARSSARIDLTVYFEGAETRTENVAPHVRLGEMPPAFGTRRLPFLSAIPDHTDLAPLHPRLLRRLLRHDVLHTTDAFFAQARTARLAARLGGAVLVNSLHTDTPAYTRIYAAAIIRLLCGDGLFGRLLVGRWRLPERLEARMARRLARHVARCHASLDRKALRRGIDTHRFAPARRDRARLAREMGVGEDRLVLAFAGRLEDGKGVMTLARASRRLLDRGLPIHAVFAGVGRRRADIESLLGAHASFPGAVDQERLAWLYASADLFVFPSAIEVSPNVVLEAKASGVPVVVAPAGGGRFVGESGVDGFVVEDAREEAWADAIARLAEAPARRAA